MKLGIFAASFLLWQFLLHAHSFKRKISRFEAFYIRQTRPYRMSLSHLSQETYSMEIYIDLLDLRVHLEKIYASERSMYLYGIQFSSLS